MRKVFPVRLSPYANLQRGATLPKDISDQEYLNIYNACASDRWLQCGLPARAIVQKLVKYHVSGVRSVVSQALGWLVPSADDA